MANYPQLRDLMAPLHPFRSPKSTFYWNDELEFAFQQSKKDIIADICQGVEIYDLQKRTCLQTDRSKRGIGYFLFQKNCACTGTIPRSCDNGWGIVQAGSCFLQPTEERDAPVRTHQRSKCLSIHFSRGSTSLML